MATPLEKVEDRREVGKLDDEADQSLREMMTKCEEMQDGAKAQEVGPYPRTRVIYVVRHGHAVS